MSEELELYNSSYSGTQIDEAIGAALAINNKADISSIISDNETGTTAARSHAQNSIFTINGRLYHTVKNIQVGDTFITDPMANNQNATEISVVSLLYAYDSKLPMPTEYQNGYILMADSNGRWTVSSQTEITSGYVPKRKIATYVTDEIATQNYDVGDQIFFRTRLYEVILPIQQGGRLAPNSYSIAGGPTQPANLKEADPIADQIIKLKREIENINGQELPTISSSDEGKILIVNSSGELELGELPENASDLPAISSSDEGKILIVNSSGELELGELPENASDLPAISSSDEGKILIVNSSGELELGELPETSETELPDEINEVCDLYSAATSYHFNAEDIIIDGNGEIVTPNSILGRAYFIVRTLEGNKIVIKNQNNKWELVTIGNADTIIINENGSIIFSEASGTDNNIIGSGLPEVSINDAGKTLVVNDEGQWEVTNQAATGSQTSLPEVTANDAGKILMVNNDGEWEITSISVASGVSF